MRIIYSSPSAIHVALSRSNLERLLGMLNAGKRGDAATLVRSANGDGAAIGILVTAEEDEPHYQDRPGMGGSN